MAEILDQTVFSDLLEHLSKNKLPVNKYRQKVGVGMSQCFGMVRKRSMAPDLSRCSWNDAKLHHLLMDFSKHLHINFSFSSIQVNANYSCRPHFDVHNEGNSYIVGFGDYIGGELVLKTPAGDTSIDIKFKPLLFNGSLIEHYTKEWTGNRYTLVFHTIVSPPKFPMIRSLSDYTAKSIDNNKWVIECRDGTILSRNNGLPHPLKGRKKVELM